MFIPEQSLHDKKALFAQHAADLSGARGKMLAASLTILLLAAILFLGIVGLFCFVFFKIGFFEVVF